MIDNEEKARRHIVVAMLLDRSYSMMEPPQVSADFVMFERDGIQTPALRNWFLYKDHQKAMHRWRNDSSLTRFMRPPEPVYEGGWQPDTAQSMWASVQTHYRNVVREMKAEYRDVVGDRGKCRIQVYFFSDQPKFERLVDGFVEDLTGAELDVHAPDGGTQLYAAVAATVDILLRDNQCCQHDNVMLQIVSDGNDDSCRQNTPTHHLHAELLQTALDALESFDRRFKGSGLIQFFTTRYGADSAQKLVRPEQLTIIEDFLYPNSGLHKGHHASRPRRHLDIISLPFIRNMSIPSTVDETEREGDADRREFQMKEAETFSDGHHADSKSFQM